MILNFAFPAQTCLCYLEMNNQLTRCLHLDAQWCLKGNCLTLTSWPSTHLFLPQRRYGHPPTVKRQETRLLPHTSLQSLLWISLEIPVFHIYCLKTQNERWHCFEEAWCSLLVVSEHRLVDELEWVSGREETPWRLWHRPLLSHA